MKILFDCNEVEGLALEWAQRKNAYAKAREEFEKAADLNASEMILLDRLITLHSEFAWDNAILWEADRMSLAEKLTANIPSKEPKSYLDVMDTLALNEAVEKDLQERTKKSAA